MEFLHHQLENGLTIVAEVNNRAYSTALGFFVNTGSRDETDEIAGVSHFLEHMAFKGTASRSAEDVNRELDEMGSHSNARTGEEHTIYHATVLPEFQDRTVKLLADIMRPALREEDFESEKKVIIEEILMYDDQPPFGGHEKIMESFFGSHPMSRSVLGTTETVGALSPDQMMEYFQRRYSPNNITLVAAGDVDFSALVSVADRACGEWESFETEREVSEAEPNLVFQSLIKDTAAQEYVLQLAQGPDAQDPRRFANRLLTTIIGDDSGSRMFWEFIDTGVAEFAGVGGYEYDGCGVIFSMLCCQPDDTQANLQRLYELQEKVQREGVTDREVQLAKRKAEAGIILASERTESRMFSVGVNWMRHREWRSVDDVLAEYAAIKIEDVHEVLKAFPLTQANTLCVGPATGLTSPNRQI